MTFIVLNYGENKQLLFNPNCQTKLLLENIKTRCSYPQELEVDLSDEYGNLKNITQSTTKYANELLKVDREKLVLIEVRRTVRGNTTSPSSDESSIAVTTPILGDLPDEEVTYIPLLNNNGIVTSKFTARLGSRDLPPSRAESRTRKPRDKKLDKSRKSLDSRNGSAERNNDEGGTSAGAKRRTSSNRRQQSVTPRKGKSKKK